MELTEGIACTLTNADLKAQRQRWLSLLNTFLRERDHTLDGVELRFRDHPAIEQELNALVAVENQCCSWATWTVRREHDARVVAACSRGEGVATLQTMFAADGGRRGADCPGEAGAEFGGRDRA